LLDDGDLQPASRGVSRNADSVDAAADDEQVNRPDCARG
jgi:hypothetical protein